MTVKSSVQVKARDDSHVRGMLGDQRLTVVDVGAAHGLPSHIAVLERVAQILMFEPNPAEAERLAAWYGSRGLGGNVHVLPVALSGTGGKRTLYVTNAPTGSSLLQPRKEAGDETGAPDYFFPLREVTVETRTLDSVLRDSAVRSVDAVKLDVQGAEYEILQGLGDTHLRQLLSVELEIGMPGAYQNQPSYSEIDLFLRRHGMELFDLRPARIHRAVHGDSHYYPSKVFGVHPDSPTLSKRIWEVDAVYFRKPRFLLDAHDVSGIRRLVSLYCVYGFFPEAIHLVESAGREAVLGSAEVGELVGRIVAWHRKHQYGVVYSPALFSLLRRVKNLSLRLICGRRESRWIEV